MRQKSVFVNWKERKWLKVRQDFKRKCENLEMTGFSDSDEAGNIDHSKSRSGYCFNINISSDTVSWPRKLQKCMCLPTFWRWAGRCSLLFEAVHLAVSKAIRRKNLDLQQLVDVLVDNQTCIALVKNSMNHRNPKHFALKVHFAHNLVKSKLLELKLLAYRSHDRVHFYKSIAEGQSITFMVSFSGTNYSHDRNIESKLRFTV